ncbi:tetratricopeptide repeat protein [Candidatus Zixiibacteriota bacterium]
MGKGKRKKQHKADTEQKLAASGWWNRPSYVFEIGLLVLAFGIRWIYLSQVSNSPFFYEPTLDAGFHLNWARSILQGNFLGTDVFFRAPLYPYLLALFDAIAGGDLFVVRIIQHLIGIVSVWGVYRLARTVGSESAAKIAGLAAAVYTTTIYFESELLLDFLLIPWMLGTFYGMHRFRQSGNYRWAFLAGLAVGLFAITRPNILLCWPVFAFAIWRWSHADSGAGRRAGNIALLAVGTLLAVLPVTVRNAAVGDDFVLISSQGGINFYIGNNAESDGLSASMPDPWGHTWKLTDVHQHAEEQMGHKLKPSEVSNYWLSEALGWWGAEPGAALKLTFKKAVMFFANAEIANNQNIRHFWQSYTPVMKYLPLPFGLIAPFGLMGLFIAARRHALAKLILWIMLIYALSVIAFFVPARFRLPLLPFLFIGCGVFIWEMITCYKEKNKRRITALSIPVILLAVFSFGPWYQAMPATDVQSVFQLGNAALRAGKLDEAAEYYRQTLAIDPHYETGHLNLGVVHLRRGELPQAIREFRAEIAAYPESAKAYANLCSVLGLQNRYMDAAQAGEAALRLEPENSTAILNLSRAWWSLNKPQRALSILEKAPAELKTSPAGRAALGGTYLKLNRFAETEEVLRPLADGEVQLDPTKLQGIDQLAYKEELGYHKLEEHQARANYNLGWMSAMQGNESRALEFFQKAISIKPDFDEAHANIGASFIDRQLPDSAMFHFRRAVEIDSANAGYVYNVGIAWLNLGDTAAAIREFERSLELDPQFNSTLRKLRALGRR